jgi:hypothetical protein
VTEVEAYRASVDTSVLCAARGKESGMQRLLGTDCYLDTARDDRSTHVH